MRIKRAAIRKTRKRKLFKLAKGFQGRKKNVYRTMVEAVHHALTYSFRDRRVRKREFRKLWIIRLNAAVRQHGYSYSRFINALKNAQISLDRKMLSMLAVEDPQGFQKLVAFVKSKAA